MLTITLDTNCIVDLDENRTAAPDVMKIVEAHRGGFISASWVAVSASERQRGDYYLPSYADFLGRLEALQVDDLPQIKGMAYWGISYWNHALWTDDNAKDRERQIHSLLFPGLPFEFSDFAGSNHISKDDVASQVARKWRNAWCDRQMLWAHDHHGRDVFVTSDTNFKKAVGRSGFERLRVCRPDELIKLIG